MVTLILVEVFDQIILKSYVSEYKCIINAKLAGEIFDSVLN